MGNAERHRPVGGALIHKHDGVGYILVVSAEGVYRQYAFSERDNSRKKVVRFLSSVSALFV